MTNFFNFSLENDLQIILISFLVGVIALQQIIISKIKKLPHNPASTPTHTKEQIIDQVFNIENTLSTCPFGLCIADRDQILWTNSSFKKICKQKDITNFSELDALLCTQTQQFTLKNNSKPSSLEIVSKNDTDPANWKRYTIIVWPIALNNQMLLFIEQTKHFERKITQSHFEYELINFLLNNCSDQHAESIGNLKTIIPQIREPKKIEAINIVEIIINNGQFFRKAFKKMNTQLITSLPHSASILHNSKDFSLAIRLILNAIYNRMPPKDQITISTHKDKKKLILEINIRQLILNPSEINEIFNFSKHQSTKEEKLLIWKLNLAIAKQIMLNYNSNLEIKSNQINGTTISFSCINNQQ